MKTRRTLTLGTLAGLGLIATYASPAISGEIKASGTGTYIRTQLERIPLPGGKFLNETHNKGVLLASDPSLPLHLASQDCDAAAVVDDNGTQAEGVVSCVTIDNDGDVYWVWGSILGLDRKWTITSGTGKYAGMTGSGTTKVLKATADGRTTSAWSGTLNMK